MMRTLEPGPWHFVEDMKFASKKSPKYRKKINDMTPACRDLANRYRRRKPANRNFGTTLTEADKKALESVWDNHMSPIFRERLRHRLPADLRGRCPYCSLQNSLGNTDHWLEKTKCPELTLYDRNLVLCCFDCNNAKPAPFDTSGQRVIHVYDDRVSKFANVLRAKLAPGTYAPVAEFFLDANAHVDAPLYARHFKTMKLAARYRNWAPIHEYARDFGTATGWPASYRKLADQHEHYLGNNEPKSALLRAMADAPKLVEGLIK